MKPLSVPIAFLLIWLSFAGGVMSEQKRRNDEAWAAPTAPEPVCAAPLLQVNVLIRTAQQNCAPEPAAYRFTL